MPSTPRLCEKIQARPHAPDAVLLNGSGGSNVPGLRSGVGLCVSSRRASTSGRRAGCRVQHWSPAEAPDCHLYYFASVLLRTDTVFFSWRRSVLCPAIHSVRLQNMGAREHVAERSAAEGHGRVHGRLASNSGAGVPAARDGAHREVRPAVRDGGADAPAALPDGPRLPRRHPHVHSVRDRPTLHGGEVPGARAGPEAHDYDSHADRVFGGGAWRTGYTRGNAARLAAEHPNFRDTVPLDVQALYLAAEAAPRADLLGAERGARLRHGPGFFQCGLGHRRRGVSRAPGGRTAACPCRR
mmetsp:Transcript_31765/g.91298  ORF Transcript_31765/g.91298 Transcript_31765/m.91298 type:complete len:298 (-) Transcript_31765:6-899(-)